MAERIVSPAVYISENDQSFVAPGLGTLGAVVIGPTLKGQAFVPTQITSYGDFVAEFGPETPFSYVPYTVRNYLQTSGIVTVMRILGNGGWRFDGTIKKLAAIIVNGKIITVFHPSQNANPALAELSGTTATGSLQSFNLTISGSQVFKAVTASLNPTSNNYITRTLGSNQYVQTGSAYPYLIFGNYLSASVAIGSSSYTASISSASISTTATTFTSSNAEGYAEAVTPWVISAAGLRLFRIHHRSQGNYTNTDVKIAIDNLSISNTIGVDSTFSVLVRQFGDTDNTPSVLEQFNNLTVNFNTISNTYVAQGIGDKYSQYDSTQQKVLDFGNYPNLSSYIRIEVSTAVANGALDSTVYPAGFEGVFETISGFAGATLPSASMLQSSASSNTYSGFDYSNTDNLNYLNPIPLEATQGVNASFFVNANDDKFIIPMQGGLDGMNYATIQNTGAAITSNNLFGYDLSSAGAGGSQAYQLALNILDNKDQYVFNLVVLPGVLNTLHPSVTSYAVSIVQDRADCFYILDLCGASDTIAAAIANVPSLNTSYAATYYPWVKIIDSATNKITLVPPSTVIPQVYAYNDNVAAPWWAPAGLKRGGIGGVLDVAVKLSKKDRDALYQASINPIASFPDTGITVWGQKTLQVANTSLNRVNVRRLLLTLEAFFANAGRNIVFDPNTNVTRNAFLNVVNPYLSMVQSKQGVYSAKVIMDDSNNTPDVIDRNEIVGAIYIQPVKAGEFVILTFNITPTGVSFN